MSRSNSPMKTPVAFAIAARRKGGVCSIAKRSGCDTCRSQMLTWCKKRRQRPSSHFDRMIFGRGVLAGLSRKACSRASKAIAAPSRALVA
jgi:hypothetical protein